MLIPKGTEGFHKVFDRAFHERLEPVKLFTNPGIARIAADEDRELVRQAKEALFGMSLEEMELGDKEGRWTALREVFQEFGRWFDGGRFISGDTPVWADMQVAGQFMLFKSVLGVESKEYVRIIGWDDGRWKRLMEGLDATVY